MRSEAVHKLTAARRSSITPLVAQLTNPSGKMTEIRVTMSVSKMDKMSYVKE